METKPTLKEIANIANVSIATASRAISNPEKVKYSTRKKIEKAIEECSMMKIKHKGTGIIGLVVPDLTNQFFPLMLTGIETVARSNGYIVTIVNSNSEMETEGELVKKLIDIGVDGIIIIPAHGSVGKHVSQALKDGVVPIVFLDRTPNLEGINLVNTDNYFGMYQATKYLMTLGHKTILYIDGTEGTSTANDRYRGFLDALTPDIHIRKIAGDFNAEKARNAMQKILAEDFKFTAVLAANDIMAISAMEVLKENGIDIPSDVSILGYDDIPSARASGLTTIKQPFVEMGMNAMYILIADIDNPTSSQKTVILPSNIIFRTSCGIAKIQ